MWTGFKQLSIQCHHSSRWTASRDITLFFQDLRSPFIFASQLPRICAGGERVRPELDPVHAEGDLAYRPDDEDDAHEEEDEADDGEGDHLEDAGVLVRGAVAGEQRSLKLKEVFFS